MVEAVSKKLQLAIEKGLIPQHTGYVAKVDEAPEKTPEIPLEKISQVACQYPRERSFGKLKSDDKSSERSTDNGS